MHVLRVGCPPEAPLCAPQARKNFGPRWGKIIKNEPIWSQSREAPTIDFPCSPFSLLVHRHHLLLCHRAAPAAAAARLQHGCHQRALMILDGALRELLHAIARRHARRAARRTSCSQRERRKAPIRRAAAAYADDDCRLFGAKSPERASESEPRVAVSTIFTQLFE